MHISLDQQIQFEAQLQQGPILESKIQEERLTTTNIADICNIVDSSNTSLGFRCSLLIFLGIFWSSFLGLLQSRDELCLITAHLQTSFFQLLFQLVNSEAFQILLIFFRRILWSSFLGLLQSRDE